MVSRTRSFYNEKRGREKKAGRIKAEGKINKKREIPDKPELVDINQPSALGILSHQYQ